MTTLSTFKKTVIVSPSTWTHGKKLIQAKCQTTVRKKKTGQFKNTNEEKKNETLASSSQCTTCIHLVSNKKNKT